jgi:integrase-like protein
VIGYDRLLFAVLHDTGMRIGEALGLRHEDWAAAERTVEVVPRSNDNGARAKAAQPRTIPISAGLVRLYADYLHGEYGDLDSDYRRWSAQLVESWNLTGPDILIRPARQVRRPVRGASSTGRAATSPRRRSVIAGRLYAAAPATDNLGCLGPSIDHVVASSRSCIHRDDSPAGNRRVRTAFWIDDHYGPRHYGVRFTDGSWFDPEKVELGTRPDEPHNMTPVLIPDGLLGTAEVGEDTLEGMWFDCHAAGEGAVHDHGDEQEHPDRHGEAGGHHDVQGSTA